MENSSNLTFLYPFSLLRDYIITKKKYQQLQLYSQFQGCTETMNSIQFDTEFLISSSQD